MAWMQTSLHGQQYQSSQLFIHWSVRLVVPHTEHLGRSLGADFLAVWQMPWRRRPMKMRTTIPVMTPQQYNDFHVDAPVRFGLTDICACDRSHSDDVRPVLF